MFTTILTSTIKEPSKQEEVETTTGQKKKKTTHRNNIHVHVSGNDKYIYVCAFLNTVVWISAGAHFVNLMFYTIVCVQQIFSQSAGWTVFLYQWPYENGVSVTSHNKYYILQSTVYAHIEQ